MRRATRLCSALIAAAAAVAFAGLPVRAADAPKAPTKPAAAAPAQPAQPKPQRPTPADIAKIEAALPDKAPAQPKKPRKVLVFTKATGFVHSSIPVAAKTFELMGKKTGAFDVTITDDREAFAPENLKNYDAILMVSTTGPLFIDKGVKEDLLYDPKAAELPADAKHAKVLRDSLLEFVKSGKGIMGIHAATDSSYKWKEYGLMMGGFFNGHPWGKITLTIDDPANPVSAPLVEAAAASPDKRFTISDEIYTFRDVYDRTRLHVLASIDLEASGIDEKFNRPQDQDYGVSWLHHYGDGRVFYTLIGHKEESYFNPAVVRHMLAGMQYALGDLAADDKPSGPLPADRLARNLAWAAKGFRAVGYGNEKAYKDAKEKEQRFTGTLEAIPDAGGISTTMRTAYYKLGDRTVFTGGKKDKALDALVGQKVELKGKAVDMNLEGKSLKEIWPAQVRPAPEK